MRESYSAKKWPQRTRTVNCISRDEKAGWEVLIPNKDLHRKVQEQWLSLSRHLKKWWHISRLARHGVGVTSLQSSSSFVMNLGYLLVCSCLRILIYFSVFFFFFFESFLSQNIFFCIKGWKVTNTQIKIKGQSDSFCVNHHYIHISCWNNCKICL